MYEKVGSEYEMFYRYDNDGRLSMVTCRDMTTGQKYYYNVVTNAQGDVVNLLGGSGAVRVTYTYDAYGRLVSMTDSTAGSIAIGSKNSIRYRGYVYDSETEMYYLQSRYYDPETGRFINCDAPDYIGVSDTFNSWNGFAYCENDPVNGEDPNGTIAITAVASALGVSVSTLVASALILMMIADIATGGKVILSFSEAIVMVIESVYDNIQFSKQNKKTKVPSKLKNGDKVKTPNTHPSEFKKNKDGTYTHKKSKWIFKKDRSNHYGGPHWDASPPNGKEGDYHNISLDGKILT